MIASPPLTESVALAAACAEATPARAAWEARGAELGRAASRNAWDLGDWLLQGEAAFGATYDLAERLTGLEQQTLRLYRHVANRFDSLTRVNNLTFNHHRAVASLPPADARALLDRALREGLSARRLAELVAAARPVTPEPVPSRSELAAARLRFAVDERQRLAELPGADRPRISLERYIADLESYVDHLARLAAEPEFNPDFDRATDDDLKGRRFGRRV